MPHSPNFAFPLLYSAQAQKEITHNEALVLIDALLPGTVVAQADDPGDFTPLAGEAWIIGNTPLSAWEGHPGEIAVYTEGGWRFARPVAGIRLLDRTANLVRRYDGSAWVASHAITEPSGGATVDEEARATLSTVLAALRQAGLVAVT